MTSQPEFLNGLDLSEAFFNELVKPLLQQHFPEIKYSAALIGSGSEVLGYDNEMSSDHHWGPRVMLFVSNDNLPKYKPAIAQMLTDNLPRRFRNFPTSFTDPHQHGVQLLDYSLKGEINHRAEVLTVHDFVLDYLGFEITNRPTNADWLTFPEQKLLTLTAGRVFHDQLNLELVRTRFNYYPQDIWLYQLASQWSRIEQDEHLMGRAGIVGDNIGSAIIAARLVRDIMRLCFIMEKRYAPYAKWFGTAFKELPLSSELEPHLLSALTASDWKGREKHLSPAYEIIAKQHNQLNITKPLPTKVSQFHERPFFVISMGEFSHAIKEQISDTELQELARKPLIGGIDVVTDNTDVLSNGSWRHSLLDLYKNK